MNIHIDINWHTKYISFLSINSRHIRIAEKYSLRVGLVFGGFTEISMSSTTQIFFFSSLCLPVDPADGFDLRGPRLRKIRPVFIVPCVTVVILKMYCTFVI